MTVSTTSFKAVYDGNGSQTIWGFSFACPDTKSIVVTIKDTTSGGILVIPPGGFAVSLNPPLGANPTPVGGTVTYPLSGAPLAVGFQISIVRSLAFIQPVSLANQSIIYPAVVEKALDYLTMLIQEGQPLLIPTPFEEGDDA